MLGAKKQACDDFEECEILDEKSFQRTLCLERKRAERSCRCLILMLVDLNTSNNGNQGDLLGTILQAVSKSTRETDIKGWHRQETILGVIFTEISADGKAVIGALSNRITQNLRGSLHSRGINDVGLSFYIFPFESSEQSLNALAKSPLYPDVAQELNERRGDRFWKRFLDIAGSLVGLLLFAPAFVLIAAAVKISSKGPILFRQQRIGQFGKPFTFFKFRSMYDANDPKIHEEYVGKLIAGAADSQESVKQLKLYKLTKDPRVTPIGGFLRRTSLDELPQFFNVLLGEMSLVGPRPPIHYEVARYSLWHRRRLLSVKPGITGLWQVGGRNKVTFDDMVRMDLQYAKSWTLWLDVKILLKTPRAAVMGI